MGKIFRVLQRFRENPVETVLYIPEYLSSRLRYEYHPDYQPEPNWESRLHGWLGATWPCPECAAVNVLWCNIRSELEAQGLRVGRYTYGHYSDAEMSLARAVWGSVLHQRPSVVLETGVARGVTSRIVLEALNRNGHGHLWSIDLPLKNFRGQTGAAVPASHRKRWSYIEGSSRRRLPSLLRSLKRIDLFIHDSLHSARNTRFEMERTISVMRPGGIMIVDDISTHQGFVEFARDFPSLETVVCSHSDRTGSFFGLVRT